MTTNKAWGAGLGAAISSGIIAALGSYLGHPVDPYISTAIMAAITWVSTYFTPANKIA